jgi:protein TonB
MTTSLALNSSMPLTPAINTSTVNKGERLTFTLFVSIVLHLVIILGVGFSVMKNKTTPPMLEITLAQHATFEEPEHADYLAQHNQKASGTLDKQKELTTDQMVDFADTEINRIQPTPRIQTTTTKTDHDKQLVSTSTPQKLFSSIKPDELHPKESIVIKGEEQTVIDVSAKISSLQAKLDRQRQQYAKKPRIKTLTSVAAKSSVDAEYLFNWQEKVEMIGNLNYPEEARRKQLYGNLRLLVTILPNGAVLKIDLLKSSGSVVLDQSAMRIVRMAAPYQPFPDELRKDIDRLEIIRTWRFEKGDIFSSENE